MKLVDAPDGALDVYVRQSWLNTAVMCPERGRNDIVRRDWSMPNEMTVLGTAVHAGIEHLLSNLDASTADAVEVGQNRLTALFDEPMQWVRISKDDIRSHLTKMVPEWRTGIFPTCGPATHVEHKFEFQLDEFDLGDRRIRVWGEGTMDAVTPTSVWDWKTSGKKYSRAEKQSQAIQPTMYAAACVAQGLLEWPVIFYYGVVIRGGGTQIVPIVRTVAHVEWMIHQIRPFIRQAIQGGLAYPWIRNDTHYLCSTTWCPYWSVCKGAHIAPSDNNIPQEGTK